MPESPHASAKIDPAAIITKQDFAKSLRAIKGATSYRTITNEAARLAAQRRPSERWKMVQLPKTTVAGVLRGRNLPSEHVLVTFLHVFHMHDGYVIGWLVALERVRSSGRRPSKDSFRPVSERDPIDLGVHRATDAGDSGMDLPLLPPFVARAHDNRLRRELEQPTANKLVLLVGRSSTGKTRSCFEAVKAQLPGWALRHPANGKDLSTMLTDGITPRTVVWLNETQSYLEQETAVGWLLHLLTEAAGPVVVVGSMWPRHWTRLTRRSSPDERDLNAPVRALLGLRQVVKIDVPDDFSTASAAELTDLRRLAETDPRLAAAIRFGGENLMITQNLAGGPLMLDRYHHDLDPHAKAIQSAAMDAIRMGHQAPLQTGLLEQAASGYLTPPQRVTAPGWFAEAIAACVEEDHGVGALIPVRYSLDMGPPDGFVLHDYLAEYAVTARRRERVPTATWNALLAHTHDPEDLNRLGHSAALRGRSRLAILFFRLGAEADTSGVAAARLIRLLVERGDVDRLRTEAKDGDRYSAAALARIKAANARPDEIVPTKERTNPVRVVDVLDYAPDNNQPTKKLKPLVERNSANTKHSLRALADDGDRRAAQRLIQMYSQQEDEEDVRQVANNGDSYATAGWIRLLAERKSEDELRDLITNGDPYAPAGLFLKFVQAGDNTAALDVLRPYVQKGEPGAAERSAELLVKMDDIAGAIDTLRPAAEAGDLTCARRLTQLLEQTRDLDGLRERADSGDRYAARLLADLLAERGDIDGLRAEMNAGNSDDAFRALLLLGEDVKEW
jgi:hypothetical protein